MYNNLAELTTKIKDTMIDYYGEQYADKITAAFDKTNVIIMDAADENRKNLNAICNSQTPKNLRFFDNQGTQIKTNLSVLAAAVSTSRPVIEIIDNKPVLQGTIEAIGLTDTFDINNRKKVEQLIHEFGHSVKRSASIINIGDKYLLVQNDGVAQDTHEIKWDNNGNIELHQVEIDLNIGLHEGKNEFDARKVSEMIYGSPSLSEAYRGLTNCAIEFDKIPELGKALTDCEFNHDNIPQFEKLYDSLIPDEKVPLCGFKPMNKAFDEYYKAATTLGENLLDCATLAGRMVNSMKYYAPETMQNNPEKVAKYSPQRKSLIKNLTKLKNNANLGKKYSLTPENRNLTSVKNATVKNITAPVT
ncbi:MAG: hypothetical protein LBM38_03145 [Clostridiales bacterium]|jgi:hypothetical protein|nr:hypothetical protein [Clostridiales bacterium]